MICCSHQSGKPSLSASPGDDEIVIAPGLVVSGTDIVPSALDRAYFELTSGSILLVAKLTSWVPGVTSFAALRFRVSRMPFVAVKGVLSVV